MTSRQNFQNVMDIEQKAKSMQSRSFDGSRKASLGDTREHRRVDTIGQSSLSAAQLVQTIKEPEIVSKLTPKVPV